MALVNCPECNGQISDKSSLCPHCGFPIEIRNFSCPECKQLYNSEKKNCPYCGFPTPKNIKIKAFIKEKYSLLVLLAVVIVIVIGILVLFNQKTNNNEASSSVGNVFEISRDEKEIESLVQKLIEYFSAGDIEKTQELYTSKFNYLDKSPYSITENTIQKLLQKTTITQKEIVVDSDVGNAVISFEVNHPDYVELMKKVVSGMSIFANDNSTKTDEIFMEELNGSELEYKISEASLNAKKVDGEWKIINDNYLEMFIFNGITGESSTQQITNNEIKKQEMEQYINQYMELTDFIVKECEGYTGEEPGITNISLKNKGDKTVDTVTLFLDFIDDSGKVILTRNIKVLDVSDIPLESGYSWKMDKGTFYPIKDLPNDINLDKVNVGIHEVTFSNTKQSNILSAEEQYINDYVELLDYNVGIFDSYDGKKKGIDDIEVKNNGDRNISSLTVTVFFQDDEGKDIAEDSFTVISSWNIGGSDVLKANYSWRMEDGRFYSFDNLADEVDVMKHRVEITEISFE